MSAVLEQQPPHRAAIDGAVYIPLALIAPSKTNPRKSFDAKKLAELADSIGRYGVLQPVLVRPRAGAKPGEPAFELVAGERRLRASSTAACNAIPAIVRDMSDFEVLELQIVENLQRDDLHPLEEAEGYQALMRKPDGVQGYATADELAARIGKSRSYVFGRLKLCALVASGKAAFLADKINASTALLIARMPPSVQVEATKKIVDGWGGAPMSYRDARDYLEREFMLKLSSAPFKITDATLHDKAGSCSDCGKRTGANPDLFDDVHADVCTDSKCFAEKKDAHQARLIAIAKEEGREVITGAAAKKVKPQRYGGELNGYLKLDDIHYNLHDSKSLAKLLGKDSPPVALLEDPHTQELIKVVRRDDALKVLKDKGVLKTSRAPTTSDHQRKAEAKAKAETLWRTTLAERAVAAAGDPQFDDVDLHAWLMPEVANAMWARLDYETAKRAAKLMGWEGGRVEDDAARKRLAALTAAQLDQALIAMAVAGQMHASQHSASKPDRLLQIAGRLGIDGAAVRAELAAAVKAKTKTKAKAKPAPAAKAKPTKTPPAARSVKYRDAATGETWSGKGLQPAWLKAALKRGKTLADFDASKAPAKKPARAIAGDDAAPIKLTTGVTLSAEAAWPFPGTGAAKALTAKAEAPLLHVGDRAKVRLTATGRKTAKDQREGTVREELDDGRLVLAWGDRPHERGVYEAAELERLGPAPGPLWPFPTGAAR